MKINSELKDFLAGKSFSNGYTLRINTEHQERHREDLILQKITNKNVIHLGCLDHVPLIDEKIKNKTWLHKLISEKAKFCLGIDINKKGIKEVTEKFHVTNMIYGDIITDEIPEIKSSEKWDYMVLGEIVEHTNNPVDFLHTIRKKYNNNINQIIVTVPNVLTLNNLKYLKNNIEIINTDHRYWFTPYTILKILYEAGYQVSELEFANRIPLGVGKLIARKISLIFGKDKKYPFSYFNTIVVTATM